MSSSTRDLDIPVARVFKPLLTNEVTVDGKTYPVRYKGAYGGRGSGKSWFFGSYLVQWCIQNPGTRRNRNGGLASDHQFRASTRMTCVADQVPVPRAVGMPCSFRPVAMSRNDIAPAACSSVITGLTTEARSAATRALAS